MSTISIPQRALPVGSVGPRAFGWWGMVAGMLTEGALFAYLLFGYYYFAIQPHGMPWPAEMPTFKLAAPNTVILLVSSVAVWWGERGAKQGVPGRQVAGLGVGFLLGALFVVIQTFEWKSKSFSLNSGPYGSLFFTITGFHMAHVVIGLMLLLPLTIWSALGYFGPPKLARLDRRHLLAFRGRRLAHGVFHNLHNPIPRATPWFLAALQKAISTRRRTGAECG